LTDELSRSFEKRAKVPNISDLGVRNEDLQMDSLGSLNAFVQATETRSFTVAGRQLGVSSSAIGKAGTRMAWQLPIGNPPRALVERHLIGRGRVKFYGASVRSPPNR
jgi:hypothetical protein